MPNTKSTYAPDRSITTTMEREPVDIGAPPDFWKILDEVQRKMPAPPPPRIPQPTAFGPAQQASALRGPAPQTTRQSANYAAAPDLEAYYGTLTYPHGSAGFYQPYMPGMNLGTGQQPVAMGYRRTGGRR